MIYGFDPADIQKKQIPALSGRDRNPPDLDAMGFPAGGSDIWRM
jgi:hypothetical protein